MHFTTPPHMIVLPESHGADQTDQTDDTERRETDQTDDTERRETDQTDQTDEAEPQRARRDRCR